MLGSNPGPLLLVHSQSDALTSELNLIHTKLDLNLTLSLSIFHVFSRVTMKMDVSYTDHSHIIGKGGNTIRRVMAETNCHIHFPDSNRSNPNEKSNQVSIAGEMSGVERAR